MIRNQGKNGVVEIVTVINIKKPAPAGSFGHNKVSFASKVSILTGVFTQANESPLVLKIPSKQKTLYNVV